MLTTKHKNLLFDIAKEYEANRQPIDADFIQNHSLSKEEWKEISQVIGKILKGFLSVEAKTRDKILEAGDWK